MGMKKRILTLLVAVALAVGMCLPAYGATVTNDTTEHTYDAYQVFKGTQAEGDSALGDVEWGSGVNGTELLEELQKDYDYFDKCKTAADVADVLAGKLDDCEEAKALASTATKHLTETKTTIVPASSEELAAGYWLIVDTTTPGEGDAKNAALLQVTNGGDIAITKKYDVPSVEKTVDDNDANIGDTVTFTLTATMPSELEGYETYKVIFHDVLSDGLAYTNNLKVTIDGVTKTVDFAVKHEGGELTVSCENVIALGAKESSKIVVTYTAVLDDDAVIGVEGNPNKVYLEYSNDPNWNGQGTEPTGNTPEKEVKVFTWEIPVEKVDATDSKHLAGAEFTLFKDADYKQAINVVLVVDNIYRVCTQSDCTDHSHATSIATDSTGKFEIEGLEKGTYYLKETKAPAGYNLLASVVEVSIGENGVLIVGDQSAAAQVVVENNKGPVLPETGGMGTTLFYIVGGILVVGAAALLIARRRSNSED